MVRIRDYILAGYYLFALGSGSLLPRSQTLPVENGTKLTSPPRPLPAGYKIHTEGQERTFLAFSIFKILQLGFVYAWMYPDLVPRQGRTIDSRDKSSMKMLLGVFEALDAAILARFHQEVIDDLLKRNAAESDHALFYWQVPDYTLVRGDKTIVTITFLNDNGESHSASSDNNSTKGPVGTAGDEVKVFSRSETQAAELNSTALTGLPEPTLPEIWLDLNGTLSNDSTLTKGWDPKVKLAYAYTQDPLGYMEAYNLINALYTLPYGYYPDQRIFPAFPPGSFFTSDQVEHPRTSRYRALIRCLKATYDNDSKYIEWATMVQSLMYVYQIFSPFTGHSKPLTITAAIHIKGESEPFLQVFIERK